MMLYVCAVFDKKVNSYGNPQCFRTKGEATRTFMDAVSDDKNLRKHAEDFIFCFLGMYDTNQGQFENAKMVPEILMSAMDCISVENGVN